MLDENLLKSQATWDFIAQSFDSTRRKPWKQCIDFLNNLKETDIILDLGCGNGRHLIQCTEHFKHVIGLDISRGLLNIAKNKLKENKINNTIFLHADSAHIPLKDETIDAIIYIASLHNVKGRENRVQSLKEIKRILKNEGSALISVWSKWQDKYRKQFFKKWLTKTWKDEFGDIEIYWRQHGLDIPRFYHLYSKKEFREDLQKAGLEIKNIQEVKLVSKKYPDNFFALVKK